jgi:hypothetical protein
VTVERRKSERTKCRFACVLTLAGKQSDAAVVDISEGGLAVRSNAEAFQGDAVIVKISVPGHGEISVEALVWHVRRARHRETGDIVYLLGLMLSKAPQAYLDLATKRQTTRAPVAPPSPAVGRIPPGQGDPDLVPYRIRLKHRASPRTRVLCVDAASYGEACEIAREQLDGEWEILEATGPTSG